jgi:hypothetical protein
MAQIDDVLAELRHRIMGSFEKRPKPAEPHHQEANEEGPAMTQSVNLEYERHGSAAVALRRLARPGRDGSVVVEDGPVSEPINHEGDGAFAAGTDAISQLLRRLSLDMPELIEEVVAFIERRTAEVSDGAAPRPTECAAPRVPPTPQDDDTGVATIRLRFDTQMLARIDAAARKQGISRTGWLHVAASKLLESRQ